jgi:hypothetical protein
MAVPQGFEPQISESESDVLPLHHGTIFYLNGSSTEMGPVHRGMNVFQRSS